MQPTFRLLDHTADVGIEAEADSLAALFDRSAAGMFSLLADGEPATAAAASPLELTAHDLPELLVAWLRELLWWQCERDWLYAGVSFASLGPTSLVATVQGEVACPPRQRIVREIKAVTYHDLVAEQRGDGWYARLIFDL